MNGLSPEELQELQRLQQAPPITPRFELTPDEQKELEGIVPFKGQPDMTPPPNMRGPGINPPQPIAQPDWMTRNIVQPLGSYLRANPVHDQSGQPYEEAGNIDTGSTMKNAGAAFGQMIEATPEGRAQIIASRVPGAGVSKDAKGNVFVDIPPDAQAKLKLRPRYIMNQPGPSWQDFRDILSFGAETTVAGKAIGLPKTAVGMGLRTAGVTGTMKAAEDIGGQKLGSGRTPDATEWLEAAGLGGFLGFGGAKLWTGLRSLGGAERVIKNGQLTPEARTLLQQSGVDPASLTPRALSELEFLLPKAASPAEAARLAKIRAEGVTPSKSDISQDPKQLALTERLIKGASPGREMSPTELTMRTLKKETQPREIAESGANLVRRLTGNAPPVDEATKAVSVVRGQEFERTQKTLKALRERDAATVRRLYQRGYAEEASMMPDRLSPLSREVQKIKESTNVGDAHKIADDLAGMIKDATAGGKVPVKLEAVELRIRQKISELGGSPDARDRVVAGQLRRAYKEWEESLTADDFVKGSPEAVKSIFAGRQKRAQMAAKFDDDPVIAGMLKAERMADGKYKLSLNPSEAAEQIVGKLTSVKGDAVSDTLQRMKTILGEKSEAWRSVKREVLLKMLEKGSGTFERDIRTLARQNPKLARELFTPDEMKQMLQHGEVARLVGPPKEKGIANYSASGYEMLRNMTTNPFDFRFYGDVATGAPRILYRNVLKGDPLYNPGALLKGTPDPLMPGVAYRGAISAESKEPDALAIARRLAAMPLR